MKIIITYIMIYIFLPSGSSFCESVSQSLYISKSSSPPPFPAPTYMYPNPHHLSFSSFPNSNFSPKYTGKGIVGTMTSNLKSSGN